jgi:hypothetical protein
MGQSLSQFYIHVRSELQMKRMSLAPLLFVGIFFAGRGDAFGTIAENITPKVIAGQCASGGTVYDNRTSAPMSFDLNAQNYSLNSCPVTISWTDANGNPQAVTIPPQGATTFGTSLAAQGKILWSSQGTSNVNFSWFLSQAVNVGSMGGNASCNSTGTVYQNLTQAPIGLHLAFVAQSYPISFSWIDATGAPQRVDLAGGVNGNGQPLFQNSEGVSTSLPAGGIISWSSGSGTSCGGAGWNLERTFDSVGQ